MWVPSSYLRILGRRFSSAMLFTHRPISYTPPPQFRAALSCPPDNLIVVWPVLPASTQCCLYMMQFAVMPFPFPCLMLIVVCLCHRMLTVVCFRRHISSRPAFVLLVHCPLFDDGAFLPCPLFYDGPRHVFYDGIAFFLSRREGIL